MGTPSHYGIKLQYEYLVLKLRKCSPQWRTQPSVYRNTTRNSIRVCRHFYYYLNEYNAVDRLMYCNKSRTTAEAKAHLRPHTQILILPALGMQVVGTRNTSTTKPIFTRCHHQKENTKTIEHLGYLKKAGRPIRTVGVVLARTWGRNWGEPQNSWQNILIQKS